MGGNNILYYIMRVTKSVVLLFVSGGLLQTFFHEIGFSVSQISSYTALASGIQTLVIILNLFIADKIKRVRKVNALIDIAPVFFCVVMLTFCLTDKYTDSAFTITMFACIALNFFQGISGVLSYRLPYIVLDMKDFAKMENTSIVLSGTFSMGTTFLITALSAIYKYKLIMTVGFILSIVFSVVASTCMYSMKENKLSENTPSNEFALSKLKKKVYMYFYIPNFIRGLCAGVMSVIPVICINIVTSNQTFVSSLVIIYSVSSIAGGLIYNLYRNKMPTAKVYLVSSIVMLVIMPFMISGKSPLIFGTLYFVVGIFYNIACNSAAIYATEIVDYYDIGTFTSCRLIFIFLGQTVAGFIISSLIYKVPNVLILAAGGLMQFLSGWLCYLWDVRFSKKVN